MTDLEIARAAKMRPIAQIAKAAGIPEDALYMYGRHMAKIDVSALPKRKPGRLVLVTAVNPTKFGEGKTTVSIGLADAMRRLSANAMLSLREPSLGPVFGTKGGAAGGGYAQVLPMEDINLHFTGDLHALSAANNLLAALLDNHIYQGNEKNIGRVTFKRCMDLNDRQLRTVEDGLGGATGGVPRSDGFNITAASEMMAALCLSSDILDLKRRIGDMQLGWNGSGEPVFARDINAQGACALLLRDAIRPNLVQTIEGTPALIHGGPFANIAHGCSSVIATKTAMALSDWCVTEAGFGADLGAEKFLDIVCRKADIFPDAVVVVASVRSLKNHGGGTDMAALERGAQNLRLHVTNMKEVYGLPVFVAVNRFPADTDDEIAWLTDYAKKLGAPAFPVTVWANGGGGATELARAILELENTAPAPRFCYPDDCPLTEKIASVVSRVYRGGSVSYSPEAKDALAKLEEHGFSRLPVCIAKTQYSPSDDENKLGAPENFEFHVRDAYLSGGAGFVVAVCGKILTMPGLSKTPAALSMDIDANGVISGQF